MRVCQVSWWLQAESPGLSTTSASKGHCRGRQFCVRNVLQSALIRHPCGVAFRVPKALSKEDEGEELDTVALKRRRSDVAFASAGVLGALGNLTSVDEDMPGLHSLKAGAIALSARDLFASRHRQSQPLCYISQAAEKTSGGRGLIMPFQKIRVAESTMRVLS